MVGDATRRGWASSETGGKEGAREEVRGRVASALASFGRYSFEQGVRVALASLVRSTRGLHQITEV